MKLVLIRHTKVDVAEGICYGQSNVNLAPSHLAEMKKVKHSIHNFNFEYLFSSPLDRCKSLARYISPSQNNIIFDHRLKELNFGDWEMKAWSDINNSPEGKIWFKDYINTPCPNGESYANLLSRVHEFITELKSINKNSVLISHGGVIRAFYSLVKNLAPEKAFDLKIDYGQQINIEI